MKKLLLTFAMMLLLVTVVILVSCGEAASTSETTPAETTPEAPAVTTVELTEKGIPVNKLAEVSALVGTHRFDEEALALMKLVIRDYYDKKGCRVLNENGDGITLWAVGSFLEAVGAVHKLYPEDEEILSVYKGLLDRGLKSFKVRYSAKKVNGVLPYYYNSSAGNTGDYYYDDDEWIAIQYMEAYKTFGDEKYLQYAQEILEFVWLGWGIGTKESDNLGMGGIPWKVGTGPLTCSNAPAAYAFATFSTLTEDKALSEEYLTRSQTVYDWVKKYLRRNGYYYIDGPGNNWSASYNNGLMLCSASMLYGITGDKTYFRDAMQGARTAYSNNLNVTRTHVSFKEDIENEWMDAWLVKGFVEYYKIDDSNVTTYLDDCCRVMAFSIENKLTEGEWAGYFRDRFDEGPGANNNGPSKDPTHLGGAVSLVAVLAEWAELYGTNYQ